MIETEVSAALDYLTQQDFAWVTLNKLRKIKEELLKAEGDLRNRKTALHLSASAVVFKQEKCFFIMHPYLKQILLPAGHVEPGEKPYACAIREFKEETGHQAVSSIHEASQLKSLIDINLIHIPRNSLKNEASHYHIDLRYQLKLAVTNKQPINAELPVFLLKKEQAPCEFQGYYTLVNV